MVELSSLDWADILPFIAVGFAAQTIDGALGMAFGVISSTLLLSLGILPAGASAGVHAAESFTTAASGTSHIAHKNVNWSWAWFTYGRGARLVTRVVERPLSCNARRQRGACYGDDRV